LVTIFLAEAFNLVRRNSLGHFARQSETINSTSIHAVCGAGGHRHSFHVPEHTGRFAIRFLPASRFVALAKLVQLRRESVV
jgi:hypothetical protein